MTQMTCPGLPASWINGWLSAVGATVLDDRIRLRWTMEGEPLAVLSAAGVEPIDALVESWPDKAILADLPIAERWKGIGELPRNVPVDAFITRARTVRGHRYCWTLSSTMTDLCVDRDGRVAHSDFDPPAPKGLTLHQRLMNIHKGMQPAATGIRDSFSGLSKRVRANGLGFDLARLGSQADDTERWVDAVVEVLAFFGLAILPVRGSGVDQRLDRHAEVRKQQRGWRTTEGNRGLRSFYWPAWRRPLDSGAIDALLDTWRPERKSTWERVGVHAGWRSVRFDTPNQADPTRGFGAERL